MKNKLKVFEPTRIKALVLAGVTLFSGTACGKKNIEKEEPQAVISVEEDTTKKKNNIETTVENMIEGKTTGENNGTGEEYSYTEDGYTEYVDPTEEIIEEQTEGKTEGKTEAKTEAKTEGKTESKTESVQSPFEHRVGNASPEKQTEAPTQKATQKTTNKTTTTIKNKDIKITTTAKKVTTAKPTTKKVTTTTTKPVTTAKPTTQKPTEPPTTQPPAPVYNYTLENITQSAEVFNYFADQMNHDIFQGSNVLDTNANGDEYWNDGYKEARVALLLLNENANYNEGVLNQVLAGYSELDLANGIIYFYGITNTEDICGGNIDYRNYTLDREIGDYMNQLNDARKNGKANGDYSQMDNLIDNYFNNTNEKISSNNAIFYYVTGIGAMCYESRHYAACSGSWDDGNFYGVNDIVKGRVKELSR